MKKRNLLLLMSLMAFGAANAEVSAQVYPNCVFAQISPDGNWAVSDMGTGQLIIVNRASDQVTELSDPDGLLWFSMGVGNCVANDGTIAVSSSPQLDDASYVKDGKVYPLPVKDTDVNINSAQAISADGSRICGGIGTAEFGIDGDAIMQIPVIWTRNEDGTYGDYVVLPYPMKDFKGHTPQYITATHISADGKTIVGQVRENQGFYEQPIVYKENEEGEWTYALLMNDVFAPEGVVWPEMPEYNLIYPSAEDFLTPEEMKAYEDAMEAYQDYLSKEPQQEDFLTEEEYQAWQDALEAWDPYESPWPPTAGEFMSDDEVDAYYEALNEWYDEDPGEPYATNFLSGESLAAFEEAQKKYDEDLDAYYEKLDKYYEMTDELSANIPTFEFNLSQISPNGQYVAETASKQESWWDPAVYTPYLFNLETGEIITKDYNALITWVGDNGELLAASEISANYWGARNPYIAMDPNGEFEPLQDYVQSKNTELYAWMEDNMRHDYYEYELDEDTWEVQEVLVPNAWLLGTPIANSDLSVFATWISNMWNESDVNYYSYILPMQITSGLASGIESSLKVKTGKGGIINLNAQANIAVYDLSGRLVYTANAANGTVATGLKAGVYLVKSTDCNGKITIVKTAF